MQFIKFVFFPHANIYCSVLKVFPSVRLLRICVSSTGTWVTQGAMDKLCQSRGLQTAVILAVAPLPLLLWSHHHWTKMLLLLATSCFGTTMSHLLFNSCESHKTCPAVQYGASPSAFPLLPLLKETFTHAFFLGFVDNLSPAIVNCLCLGFFKLAMSFSSLICCSELSILLHCSPSSSSPTLCVLLPLSAVLCNLIDLWRKC